jgi:hypothetical protein
MFPRHAGFLLSRVVSGMLPTYQRFVGISDGISQPHGLLFGMEIELVWVARLV